MISSTICLWAISAWWGGAKVEGVGQEIVLKVDVPGGEEVIQGGHAGEKLNVLEGTGDAQVGDAMRGKTSDLKTLKKISPRCGW